MVRTRHFRSVFVALASLALVLALGRADALSGCFLDVDDDLEELLAQAETIRREQRLMLRLRTV